MEAASPMTRKMMQMELAAIAECPSDDDDNQPTGAGSGFVTRSMTQSNSNGSLSLPANSMTGGEQHIDTHALDAVLRDKSGNSSLLDKSASERTETDGEQNNLLFHKPETQYTESMGGFSPSSPSGPLIGGFSQATNGLGLKLQKTQRIEDDEELEQPKFKSSKTLHK